MKVIPQIISVLLVVALHALSATVITAQNPDASIPSKIDNIFSSFDDLQKPGAAVAVVKDGKIIFKKGYGSANLEYNIPVSPSTVFHIASISKQFTVFSILLLAEQGKLSLEDDIRKYIPEVPDFGKKITLRHLANHTSGLRDQWELLIMAGWRMDDVITKEHILKLVAKQKELNFNPGEEYAYCNTGFTLLAEVVARISGKSFAAFTQENIFTPLNMSSTLFYDDHERVVKNRAYSYYPNQQSYKKSVLNFANAGATSLFTTVEDLSLWSINFSTLKIGSAAIFKEMRTLAQLNDGSNFGGALGQFIDPYKGLNQIQHGGADAGYRAYFARFPDQNFAVMVFSNASTANAQGLALQVADLYLAPYFKTAAMATTTEMEMKTPTAIKMDTETLKSFEAHYWNEEGSYAREMKVQNDTLFYVRGANNSSPLQPIGPNEFLMLNVNVDLRVKFDMKTSPAKMVVVINGGQPIVSEAFTPKNYSTKELQEFQGVFYSDELRTSYTIEAADDMLVLKHDRVSDQNLQTRKEDLFGDSWNTMFEFVRDENRQITGFKVSTGRVRNLLFKKLN